MPWYRIYAHHGPGHQSNAEFYDFYEAKLNPGERQEAWRRRFEFNGNFDSPVGGVKLMKGLPAHILGYKIADTRYALRANATLLKVLKTTPAIPVIAVRLKFDAGKVSFAARLLSDPTVEIRGKTRTRAVRNLIDSLNKGNPRKVFRRKDFEVITR